MTNPHSDEAVLARFYEMLRPVGGDQLLMLVPKINEAAKIWVIENKENEIKAFILAELKARDAYVREVVICAAVRAKDGTVYRGHRHGHALYKPFGLQGMPGYEGERPHGDDQGFITSRNRYVNRYEAMELQLAAGIKSADPGGYRHEELFSEDLY